MNLIDKIYYWYYRRKNGYPHQLEMLELIYSNPLAMTYLSKKMNRAYSIASTYAVGVSIDEIATMYETTPENVKQSILRIWVKYRGVSFMEEINE